jgi:hypothetical protein
MAAACTNWGGDAPAAAAHIGAGARPPPRTRGGGHRVRGGSNLRRRRHDAGSGRA